MFYYYYFSSFKFHHLVHNFVQCPLIKWTFKQKTYDVGRAPKKKKKLKKKKGIARWNLTTMIGGVSPY